ncbi:MAG: hypothetical protein HY670_08350 [Chloroflexi bacterium]|nr:hypothetical protein [Chloroflexota bacterium]
MGIASSMKELTQDLASSREDRAKVVDQIRAEAKRAAGEARNLIRDFQTSRQETGAELRRNLAQDKTSREADVKQILEEAEQLLKNCQTSRRKQGSQLRRELAQGSAKRKSTVGSVLKAARQTVLTFRAQRREAGNQLQEGLARGRAGRESAVGELRKGAQEMVKGFARSRKEAGETLRRDLVQGRAARESAVKALVTSVNEMRKGFRQTRAALKADIGEATAAWRKLTRDRPARKSHVKAAPEAAGVAEVAEAEIPDLEVKLLSAINQHSQGITLTEVAESLGVVPIVLGRVSRRLLDEGKIRKEDKTYFPVAGR